ncbi:bifunctional 2-polyprenyl-6-hydroxyphenol methylase/3-demethylubiquinol 3-O-methyltransferase UbiG [Pedobacter sp. SYP-B3415]|uniref:class I SAM-dependent methyltransferase n=1 Tax=Pedobacter sp. SYP-B3415 TaxID=2496641 RepID=UPI00101C7956|nr:class I SAM-dependent methyltransferase [Pedobacter sp. SYP-B3415]
MDVYGKALLDFYTTGHAETLWLNNSYGEPEEMPVDVFFRKKNEMPQLELIAMRMCRGSILDIGAGAGSHALALQRDGKDVTAIDVSEGCVEVMKKRKVKKALQGDVFRYKGRKFDTLLLLMNGIGLCGTVNGFNDFLRHIPALLAPGGQVIFDSSDIRYLYDDLDMPASAYYGEISYQYTYKGEKGSWFNWLYLDQDLLKKLANAAGWNCEILFDDGEDQFLVQLTLKTDEKEASYL